MPLFWVTLCPIRFATSNHIASVQPRGKLWSLNRCTSRASKSSLTAKTYFTGLCAYMHSMLRLQCKGTVGAIGQVYEQGIKVPGRTDFINAAKLEEVAGSKMRRPNQYTVASNGKTLQVCLLCKVICCIFTLPAILAGAVLHGQMISTCLLSLLWTLT